MTSIDRRTVCAAGLMNAVLPALSRAAPPPAQFPQTPVGRRFAAFLEVYNRGDWAELTAYVRQAFPSDPDAPEFVYYVRSSAGPWDLYSIESASDVALTALFAERESDSFDRIEMRVGPAEPHLITAWKPDGAPRPPTAPKIPVLGEAELIAALRAKLVKETAAGTFSGAVLLNKDGRPIFSYAGGYADQPAHIPNTVRTRFGLGSMAKMFTLVAIAQLAQKGRIELAAPFGTYVRNYPNAAAASKVTIEELITHTGGTGDIFGPLLDAHRATVKTLDDYVALLGARDLAFEPGGKRRYSNFGFIILGVVIERVTNASYYDYVRDHVFEPARMPDTGFQPEAEFVERRARGYTLDKGVMVPTEKSEAYRGTSAGGGYSTVGDLTRFGAALMSNRLLDPEWTSRLTSGHATIAGNDYRYDLQQVTQEGVRYIGHNGAAPGENGDLRIFANGYAIAAQSNFGPPWQKAAAFVTNRIAI
jgi:D-alanyl-D-alanine carboxypeptidase